MSAANAPIAVAQGVSVRALALGVGTSDSAAAAAAEENSGRPEIYFTAAQMPNRVMAIPPSGSSSGAVANAANASVATSAASASLVAVAGNGSAGSLGDGGAATAAQLSLKSDSPYMRSGVAVAPDGTIFIADTKNSTIRRISSASSSEPGVIRSVAGKWGPAEDVHLSEPMGLALDRAGNLYIADRGANAIFELHDATASTPGSLEIVAHAGSPTSIAVTPDGGRVLTAAPRLNSVFGFNIQGGTISSASYSLYSFVERKSNPNLSACTAINSANAEQHGCPAGIAVDGAGNVFVSDPIGNQIIRLDSELNRITLVVHGVSGPGDMTFDADGNLFVAEQLSNRIIEIKGLGQQVANVTLTPPPPPVPPAGVPCPAIAPPPGFAANTNFCAEPLGGTTPTATFTLTNNTNAALTSVAISTIGLAPGDFVVSNTSCTSTLNAGANCLINLGFAPTATGTRTATLIVTYMGAANPLASAVAGTGDDYQLALASGQLTQISVLAGGTGTFMLQVVPDNIFTGTVTFVCPGNTPPQTTCTFSPTSVTVTTPGTAVPFSVAFQTTSRTGKPPAAMGMPLAPGGGDVASAASVKINASRAGAFMALGIFAMLAFLLIVPMYVGKFKVKSAGETPAVQKAEASTLRNARWRVKFVHAACVPALMLGVAAILEGCHHNNTKQIIGTPAGSYKMTVQATSQSAPRGISVTLDVQ